MFFKFFIIFLVFSSLNCRKLPSIIKTCNYREADYRPCLKGAAQNALKQLENPIPELDLPSFKQLNFSNKMNRNHHSKAYSIEEKIENGAFYDITTAHVEYFDVNFQEKKIFGLLTMEPLNMRLNFSFNGEAFSEPVHFNGAAHGNFDNTKLNITSTFEIQNKGKETKHLRLLDAQISWTFSHGNFFAESYDSEKEEKHWEELLKTHFNDMFAVVKPDYEAVMASMFIDYGNRIFSKISATDMFGLD